MLQRHRAETDQDHISYSLKLEHREINKHSPVKEA